MTADTGSEDLYPLRLSGWSPRWIASCVGVEYCPNAQRCVDPFHVVSWATDALDQVRRQAWSKAHRQAKNLPKRKQGRPAKVKTTPEKKQIKTLKNLRYALLKIPKTSLKTSRPSCSS